MLKIAGQLTKSSGLPPGTAVFVGEQRTQDINITVIDYNQDICTVQQVDSVQDCFQYTDTPTVTWINVDGIHDPSLIEHLGQHYGLHPLIIEDILNTQQRIKVDIFEKYILISLKMHTCDEDTNAILIEQVSIVLMENLVLTFQEEEGDVFDQIRSRLQSNSGRVRKFGADYLAYALVDAIVDSYFKTVEYLGQQVEYLEDEIMKDPKEDIVEDIHFLKRELLFFRRSAWPMRNMLSELERQASPLIKESTIIYLKDLYDHVIQIIDMIEIFRDMVSGMFDMYMSSVSHKMNEIMKFLTIMGTIFIPLTFIAGIYGMNFHYMPELTWKWGYFAVLGCMTAIGAALLYYFKRKKWL